jgi:hypothetical protein
MASFSLNYLYKVLFKNTLMGFRFKFPYKYVTCIDHIQLPFFYPFHPPIPFPFLANHCSTFRLALIFFHKTEHMWHLSSCFWFISINIISSRFIHSSVNDNISFFMTEIHTHTHTQFHCRDLWLSLFLSIFEYWLL